jgi:hypothetical protein
MARKKKKITEKELDKQPIKARNNLIQDTSADPMLCDVNAPEEGREVDGLLTLRTQFPPRTNHTYSFRIAGDLIDHFKNEARKASLERKEDINWQRLIVAAALEKYPLSKEK